MNSQLGRAVAISCLTALSSCGSTGLVEGGPASSDIDSTGTLWVWISVDGGFVAGMQPQAVINVGVWEAVSRDPAYSAKVKGGPIGAMVEIAEDPTNPGLFKGSRDLFSPDFDYTMVWEFSVERGPDHVRRVILLMPSYPSVQLSQETDGLQVSWSPNHEAGVRSSVFVQQATPAPPPAPAYQASPPAPSWTSTSLTDEGTAGPFPTLPVVAGYSYSIQLGRAHNYEFDWGRASLSIAGEAWLGP